MKIFFERKTAIATPLSCGTAMPGIGQLPTVPEYLATRGEAATPSARALVHLGDEQRVVTGSASTVDVPNILSALSDRRT